MGERSRGLLSGRSRWTRSSHRLFNLLPDAALQLKCAFLRLCVCVLNTLHSNFSDLIYCEWEQTGDGEGDDGAVFVLISLTEPSPPTGSLMPVTSNAVLEIEKIFWSKTPALLEFLELLFLLFLFWLCCQKNTFVWFTPPPPKKRGKKKTWGGVQCSCQTTESSHRAASGHLQYK